MGIFFCYGSKPKSFSFLYKVVRPILRIAAASFLLPFTSSKTFMILSPVMIEIYCSYDVGYSVEDDTRLWLADAKLVNGQLKTCGADDVLADYTCPGPTPEEAFEELYREIDDDLIVSNPYWRADLDKVKYPNILYRLYRLREMRLW